MIQSDDRLIDLQSPPPGDEDDADFDAAESGVEESGPERRCVATGRVAPKETLLRFVVAPDGAVVPDLDHKLPGRGLYLEPSAEAVALVLKKHGFSRAARRPVSVAPDLGAQLDHLIATRCRTLIGLARRAGSVVMGYDQVDAWLKAKRAGLLLQAADAAPGGRTRLRDAARGIPCLEVLNAAELAEPFGRDYVVHVAIAPGGLARRITEQMTRLAALRLGNSRRESA